MLMYELGAYCGGFFVNLRIKTMRGLSVVSSGKR